MTGTNQSTSPQQLLNDAVAALPDEPPATAECFAGQAIQLGLDNAAS